MPQQERNCGLSGHSSIYGCRFCLIDEVERDDQDYDIVGMGRYHHQMVAVPEHESLLRRENQGRIGEKTGHQGESYVSHDDNTGPRSRLDVSL